MSFEHVKQLSSWVRDRFGPVCSQRVVTLSTEVSDLGNCKLQRFGLEDEARISGLVALWELDHDDAIYTYLILLIRIDKYELEVQNRDRPKVGGLRRHFELEAQIYLRKQEHIGGTHLVAVAFVSKEPVAERNGEKFRSIDCLELVKGDLEGRRLMPDNRPAIAVVEHLCRHLLNMQPSRYHSWEQRVMWYLDWREQLEKIARAVLSNCQHKLQPLLHEDD